MKTHLTPALARLVFPLIGITLMVVLSSGTAFSASKPSQNHLKHVTVHMHVVKSVTISRGDITPQGTTPGNCGTIEFYVDDDGGGNADFWMLVSSDYGTMTSLTYSWSWHNWGIGNGQNYGRTLSNVPTPWYQDPTYHTGAGYVAGAISATDVTGGQTCYGSESDGNDIT